MKKTMQMISVLTMVGIISGAALAFIYIYANPLIAQNQKNEIKEAVFNIFPEAKSYEPVAKGGQQIFSVKDPEGKLLGYAFQAEGNGYQGAIKLMAGIKPDAETLVGIEILESQETPGLGQEIAGNDFKKQFIGLEASPEITYVKNKKPEKPNEIQAITGATISSRAVVSILNAKIEKLKKILP